MILRLLLLLLLLSCESRVIRHSDYYFESELKDKKKTSILTAAPAKYFDENDLKNQIKSDVGVNGVDTPADGVDVDKMIDSAFSKEKLVSSDARVDGFVISKISFKELSARYITNPTEATSAGKKNIVVAMPFSNPKYAKLTKDALFMFLLSLNEAKNTKVNVVPIDVFASQESVSLAVQKIKKIKPSLIVGSIFASDTAMLAKKLIDSGVKTKILTYSADERLIQKSANNSLYSPNVIVFGFNTNDQISSVLEFLNAAGKKNVGLILPSGDLGLKIYQDFKSYEDKNIHLKTTKDGSLLPSVNITKADFYNDDHDIDKYTRRIADFLTKKIYIDSKGKIVSDKSGTAVDVSTDAVFFVGGLQGALRAREVLSKYRSDILFIAEASIENAITNAVGDDRVGGVIFPSLEYDSYLKFCSFVSLTYHIECSRMHSLSFDIGAFVSVLSNDQSDINSAVLEKYKHFVGMSGKFDVIFGSQVRRYYGLYRLTNYGAAEMIFAANSEPHENAATMMIGNKIDEDENYDYDLDLN